MTKLSDLLGGGGGGPTELGSSYATGTFSGSGTDVIVAAGANTAGVELRTVALSAGANVNRPISLSAGANKILEAAGGSASVVATNLLVPAGVEVSVSGGTGLDARTYYITYEVL